jgi:hypothetical protein
MRMERKMLAVVGFDLGYSLSYRYSTYSLIIAVFGLKSQTS